MNQLTNRLVELRKEKELTQREVAKFLGIQQVQYSRYETGVRTIGIELINKLAKFYDVNIEYLIGISNVRNNYPRK